MVEHVRGQDLASGGCFGQCVGLFVLGSVHVLQGKTLKLSLKTVDSREILHECGVFCCIVFFDLADNHFGVCFDYAGSDTKCPQLAKAENDSFVLCYIVGASVGLQSKVETCCVSMFDPCG
jgi:hypothetical protein